MPDPATPETPAVVPSTPATPSTPVIDPPEAEIDADANDLEPDAIGDPVEMEEPAPEGDAPADPDEPEADPPAEAPAEPTPDEPAPEEPAKAEPPAPADTEAARQAQIAAAKAYQQFRTGLDDARAKLADPAKFDAIDDAPAILKTLADGLDLVDRGLNDLHRQQDADRQERAAAAFWADYGKKNPAVGSDRAKQLFDAEVQRHAKRGLTGQALAAAAEATWEIKVEALKGSPKPAAKPATPLPKAPAINRGGARITPKAANAAPTKPPKPKALTVDEKIVAGHYGKLTGLTE